MAAKVPGRNPHTGEEQGVLLRHPQGSNGGVHRGPDKFPRRNAIRAIFLHAMAQEQEREHINPSTGEPELDATTGKPVTRKMRMAMVQDIVMAYQLIARNAATGKDLDQFLRMMADAHNMLQPEKDEAGEGRAPIPARFVFAADTLDPQPEGEEAPAAASSRLAEAHPSHPTPSRTWASAALDLGLFLHRASAAFWARAARCAGLRRSAPGRLVPRSSWT